MAKALQSTPRPDPALVRATSAHYKAGSARAYGRGNCHIGPPLKLVWAWLKVNAPIFFLFSKTFKLSNGADTVFHLLQLTISML